MTAPGWSLDVSLFHLEEFSPQKSKTDPLPLVYPATLVVRSQTHPMLCSILDSRKSNSSKLKKSLLILQGLVNVLFCGFEHHLQIHVGNYIPNSWVVFSWDIYQPLFFHFFEFDQQECHTLHRLKSSAACCLVFEEPGGFLAAGSNGDIVSIYNIYIYTHAH